ncbi:hypothetical protein [Natronoflexus pectinivorans]|uniref:Uncharacterized protein n=1 Tax=Natronoflexus pectinivorans TaxID=682526 RepID=A0A4R2GFI5_9BACT|nr:hypothetical protein [Natronoflexus pectinivorans]TCO06968.1 hypothetical protein EV194_11188 [Natronoflexus pectinivorans]
MNKEKIESTFLDVRKAYRLLFHYQKRVLNLVDFISKEFGFDYKGGYPIHMDSSPNKGRGELCNSPWNWLNMYAYEFRMKSQKFGRRTVDLSIYLQSDSGAPFKTNHDMDELDKYDSLDKSKTRLHFLLTDKALKEEDYNLIIDDGDIPHDKDCSKFLEHNGGKLFIKAFNLSEFINEEKSINILLEIAKEFKSKTDIELKILKNRVDDQNN